MDEGEGLHARCDACKVRVARGCSVRFWVDEGEGLHGSQVVMHARCEVRLDSG